jgi:hypothetical protein
VGVQLVDDRQRGRQAVQAGSVRSQDAQMPTEHVGLVRVVAPAELQVADDHVLVLEPAGERRSRLEQDPRLLPRACGAVDGGVLDHDQMMERDGGEQGCFPLPSWEQGDELPLRARGGLRDPLLEWLQLQPDPFGEGGETAQRVA